MFLPTFAHADLVNPEYYKKTCNPGEIQVVCNTTGFAPDAPKIVENSCDKYKNANYYFLVGEGHSYGGKAKYCQVGNNPLVQYSYYLLIFALTFVLELIVLFIFGYRNWRSVGAIFLANLVTVPLFQLAMTKLNFPLLFAYSDIIVLEIGVIILESVIIFFISQKNTFLRTFLLVALANAVSAILGSYLIQLILK